MEVNENVLQLKIREQELHKELTYWKEEFKPSGNMGKWYRQVRLDKITEKLKGIQEKIHFHDSIYLSNEIYKEWNKL